MRPHRLLAIPVLLLLPHAGLQAQIRRDSKERISIPLVGCKSDGQAGPVEAPENGTVSVGLTPTTGANLAYYKAASGIGVLAPRGWHCFATYGSGGDTLFVTPEPIDTSSGLSSPRVPSGPAVQVSFSNGDTSGRFRVAEIVARVFPAYKSFALDVMKAYDMPTSELVFAPYPKDVLTYRTRRVVEFTTPPHTDGLGTRSFLTRNGSPIRGVAMLVGKAPDLIHLSVRLPLEIDRFTQAIISQLEQDTADFPRN